MITCSIVVPVHNEAEHLEGFVMEFWKDLGSLRQQVVEIHLVENGSADNTFQVATELGRNLPGMIIPHEIGIPSYGEALKRGIQSSVGDVICIFELDLMDKQFISTSLSLIKQNRTDFVVASKRHPESIDQRPAKRRVLTFLFNCWLKMNFSFPGTDTHGLKAIRATVAKSLCELSITGGEVFQTELVLLAHRLGYRVSEVPITLSEHRATRVSVVKRLPKVVHIMEELKASLGRFPVKRYPE